MDTGGYVRLIITERRGNVKQRAGKRAKTAGEPAVFLEGEEMKKRETTKRKNAIYGNGEVPRNLHRPQVDGKKRKRSAGVCPLAETKDTRGGGGSGDEFVSEM